MTTVLSVHNSDGCVGWCDANCHDAKNPKCTCICGGVNHGVGLSKAVENIRAVYDTIIETLEEGQMAVLPEAIQMEMEL